jgi:hypothetical protein
LFDDWKRLQQAVGRRTAVRYGLTGLVAMAAAACGSDGKEAVGEAASAGPSGGAPTTLAGHAIEAFVRGTWQVEITPKPNYDMDFRTVTVADGRWRGTAPPYVDEDLGPTTIDESGTYSLAGGMLSVAKEGSSNPFKATGVPDQVAGTAEATLAWTARDGAFPLDVSWDGKTLTIRGKENFVVKAVRA